MRTVAFVLFSILISQALFAAEDDAVSYRKAIAVISKMKIKKEEYETIGEFASRMRIDCDSNSNPLCKKVYYEKEVYVKYDPEVGKLYFNVLFDNIYSLDSNYLAEASDGYCFGVSTLKSKTKWYVAANAFGASVKVRSDSYLQEGVAFKKSIDVPFGWGGRRPSPGLGVKQCYNTYMYARGLSSVAEFNQELVMNRDEYKANEGAFVARVEGYPESPYKIEFSTSSRATISSPSEFSAKLTALYIRPVRITLFGKRTGKVYLQQEF
ncbi:hypothetical protein K5M36_16615 [Chromobacterium vaccinii]|nr:hypothetical protein [Chromobacterium vaccinii]